MSDLNIWQLDVKKSNMLQNANGRIFFDHGIIYEKKLIIVYLILSIINGQHS